MELLGIIGEQSCAAPKELFKSLLLLCNSPTNANIQTFALDELLQSILSKASSDEDRVDAVDFAIAVNECIQSQALPNRCNLPESSLYEGESFYFAQYIFTMQQ